MVINVVKVDKVPELEELIGDKKENVSKKSKKKNEIESESEEISESESESETESDSSSSESESGSSSNSSESSKPMSVVSSCSSKISFDDDDIVKNDALYYILSKFFLSSDGTKNLVDVLVEINDKLVNSSTSTSTNN
jgi:hypothetical protein